MKKLNLNENFICRIWENGAYYNALFTTDNLPVEVLSTGLRNYDAGPDYKDASLKINGSLLTGSVEIHKTFADWKAHKHHKDAKYNDVILHVVMWDEGDSAKALTESSRGVYTVILSRFLSDSLRNIWSEIISAPSERFKIPCYPENEKLAPAVKKETIRKMAVERLKKKAFRIRERLNELSGGDMKKPAHWNSAFFEFTCEALGYSKNKVPFKKLAESISLSRFKSSQLSKTDYEAVMFGCAGFLHDLTLEEDKYISELKIKWDYFKNNFSFERLTRSEWSSFRLRPSNFPAPRIAYAASLAEAIQNDKILKPVFNSFKAGEAGLAQFKKIMLSVPVTPYWFKHYDFKKPRKQSSDVIGDERITDIFTNVLLPLEYVYAEEFQLAELKAEVLNIFSSTKKRSTNEITRLMKLQLGVQVSSLADEQGILQMHNNYCVTGKCNHCYIGKSLYGDDMVNEPLKIILY